MEFNQLEIFIQVAKLKSFSKAAKQLYLTQPTISSHIHNLENELGTILIDRKSKTITLTSAGRFFYKYAVELINKRDVAKLSVLKYHEQIEGVLEINTSSIPEAYVLPDMIGDFSKLYPKVKFIVNHMNSKNVCEKILSGFINFGIVGAKYEDDSLVYEEFCEDELVLATSNVKSENHFDDLINIGNILKEKWIVRNDGSGSKKALINNLNNLNLKLSELNIVATIENNDLIKSMIIKGIGISYISKIAIQNEVENGLIKAYRIKDFQNKRKFYLVHSKNRTLAPLTNKFLEFIKLQKK